MNQHTNGIMILSCMTGIMNLIQELMITLREKNKNFKESIRIRSRRRRTSSDKRANVEKADDGSNNQHQ